VKIQSINAHKITANLISGKTVLKTMQLNGRITDGAFLLKRRHAYKFPGLVFFWATGSWDVQFSINNDKELVVNGAEDCIAAILILPLISSHSQSESIYKRN
jgi:hypothetical protein